MKTTTYRDNFRVSILERMIYKNATVINKLLDSVNMYIKETAGPEKFAFVGRKADLKD